VEGGFPSCAPLRAIGHAQSQLQAPEIVNGSPRPEAGARILLQCRLIAARPRLGVEIVRTLAFLTLLLSAADHWTTYLCLRSPLKGWEVSEANPIAEWLFEAVGLVPGLLLDSAVTLGAVAFLLTTRRISGVAKFGFFGLIAAWTGIAVVNNLNAISTIGISVFGTA